MKIKISPLLIIMAAALCALGYYFEFIVYFITIVLHEMAHAQVAQKLGYSLNVMKLMPHGASLTGSFEGVRVADEILIALAGPLLNLLLAVFFVALWWLVPDLYTLTELFVLSNVSTALFNLLPVFPLDGGRALLAILSKWFKRSSVYTLMRITGAAAAAVFTGFFIYSLLNKLNITFASVGIFIFISTVFPDKNSKYQRLYAMAFRTEKIKNGLTVKEIMVRREATFLDLARLINGNYYHRFIITDESFRELARINESELETLSLKCAENIPVIDIVKTIDTKSSPPRQ